MGKDLVLEKLNSREQLVSGRQPWATSGDRHLLINLKEFALCYERHPESVRTVPWLRAAGRDSIPALPSLPSLPLSEFQFDSLYSVRLPKKTHQIP